MKTQIEEQALEKLREFCDIANGVEWEIWSGVFNGLCPECKEIVGRDLARMTDDEVFKSLAGGKNQPPTMPDWVSQTFQLYVITCLFMILERDRRSILWN